MSQAYRAFFGLSREPFSSELKVEEILKTDAVLAVADRVDYAIRLGAMAGSRPEGVRSLNSTDKSPGNWRSKPPAMAVPP
jgi:hypothetical protein